MSGQKVKTYEYAGFQFEIVLKADGTLERLVPSPGQHRAAYKERHRMAAIQQYQDDHERTRSGKK